MIIQEVNMISEQEETWCIFCDKKDGCSRCDALDWKCGFCDHAEDVWCGKGDSK
ncbi:hypothetical protein HAHI6034_07570 [Hathewaya histolytica]|uniref:Uncharacterized protein n=1 Tax=Hathewaya histolytica TaxID=1498 RepID=A0A4U9QVY9_HATHI|nr:hypothetical protein [Hathewaya histolytica]VTQ82934.1 Uncharacterised protein [Hathewaya histolytica]